MTSMLYSHLPPRLARLATWTLITVMVIVTIIATLYALVAPATYDDFCRGAWPQDLGLFFSQMQMVYENWLGRWFSHSIFMLVFPHIGLTTFNYNLLILLSPFLWLTVFHCFLHIFFRKSLTWRTKLSGSAVLTVIYWVGMPGAGETWYWLTGTVEDQLPFLLATLSLTVLSSSWLTGPSLLPRILGALLGAVLAILTTGLHELVALLLIGGVATALMLAVDRKRWDLVAIYAGVIVITLGGLWFNLNSPGTAIRGAQDFPDGNNPGFAIQSLLRPESTPLMWLMDPRLLCLSVVLLTSPAFLKLRPQWLDWRLPAPTRMSSMSIAAPIIGLASVVLGFFAVAYAQGAGIPPRVMNLLYALFIIAWIVALIPIGRFLGGAVDQPNPISDMLGGLAVFMLPLSIMMAPITLRSITEGRVTLTTWHSQISQRDQLIRAKVAAGEKDIVVPRITIDPGMFFWTDLGPDASWWPNDCQARFYGAETLRTEEPAAGDAQQ